MERNNSFSQSAVPSPVAYRRVSSAKRTRCTPIAWLGGGGGSLIYKLYSLGDRMEPCDTPASIYLGVANSPSTGTLNFLWDKRNKSA
jgi:hypothetical protein